MNSHYQPLGPNPYAPANCIRSNSFYQPHCDVNPNSIPPGIISQNPYPQHNTSLINHLILKVHRLDSEVRAQNCFLTVNWCMLIMTFGVILLTILAAGTIWPALPGSFDSDDLLNPDTLHMFLIIGLLLSIFASCMHIILCYIGIKAYSQRDVDLFVQLRLLYVIFLIFSVFCLNVVGCMVFTYCYLSSKKLKDICEELAQARHQLAMFGITVQIKD